MKTTLLLIGTAIASMSFGQCSDLFISEYVEGWSNNKAIEIYNPTGASIDLSEYVIIRYSNGATTADATDAVQLTGTIGANDVHVGVIEKLIENDPDPQEAEVWDSLQARADAFYCPDYNVSNAFYWNGDDAVVLGKGSVTDLGNVVLVDLFGKIGEDPGAAWTSDFPYTGAGVEVTKDHSLIRKSTITEGQTNATISHFNPLGEYDSIPAVIVVGGVTQGNWATLGSHTCDCLASNDEVVAAPVVSVYPNPSTGKFSVKGAGRFSTIVVTNALGQKVSSIANNSNATVSFDLKAKRGVYFVRLMDNQGNKVTRRVIIK